MIRESGYGITLPVLGLGLRDHRDWLRVVEAAGYTDLWSGEATVADAFGMLAMASTVVTRLNLGTAIVPAFTRAPGLLAVSAATLAALAPARCTIGIGASSVAVVQNWGGVPYEHPYQRTRDVVRFLRQALTGERVTVDYPTVKIDGLRLVHPPAVQPDLLIAALRPSMLTLAGRDADGAVLTWVSPADVRTMAPYVTAGGADRRLVVWVSVCPSTDAKRVRDQMRPFIAEYLNVAGYAASQTWLGRAAQLTPMWEAWRAGRRRDAVAAVPDALIDELVVHGSPERCRARLAEYFDAGATSIAVSLVALDVDPTTAAVSLAPR